MHRHLRIRNLSPAKRGGGIFGFTKNNSEISKEKEEVTDADIVGRRFTFCGAVLNTDAEFYYYYNGEEGDYPSWDSYGGGKAYNDASLGTVICHYTNAVGGSNPPETFSNQDLTNQKHIFFRDFEDYADTYEGQIYFTAVAKPGYKFQGWCYETFGNDTVWQRVCDTTTWRPKRQELGSLDENVYYKDYVYAVFAKDTSPQRITVTARTGISSVSGGGSYNPGTAISVTASVMSGYTFQKWTTSDSASAAAVSTSSTYRFAVSVATTLYAWATPNTCTVTANAGAGITSVSGSGEYNIGSTATVTATAKTGYTFQKWTTSNSASAAAVSTSATYSFTVSSATTLYAWATLATYTVTFNPNGGTYNNSTTTTTKQYNYETTDTLGAATRNGYTFAGWKVTTGAGNWPANTVYQATTSYKNGYGNPTLTAQWTLTTYTVTFNPNGGTYNNSTSITTKQYNYETTDTLGAATRNGYTFAGWKVTTGAGNWPANTVYQATTSYKNGYGNPTLTAQWTVNSYELDVNGNLDEAVSGGTSGYATFDVYINGSKVATGVSDYCTSHPYGSTYEIKNIQCINDKAYVGVYSDNACTTASSLSGTIGTSRRIVCLKFRTKTWEDYAASSYTGGSGTQSNPYIIKTPEQLGKLSKDSKTNELRGVYYKLGSNINLSAHIWTGIGDDANSVSFMGSFDGDLFTISDIKTSVDNYIPFCAALFQNSSGVICNIIIKGGIFKATDRAGAILGDGSPSISNCIVDGVNVESADRAAGIASVVSGKISSCILKNGSISGNRVAGIAGWTGSLIIEDCSVVNAVITGAEASLFYNHNEWNITINSTYGQGTVNGTASKVMYGDSSDWGNWTYNSALNGGYPVQKPLFAIGGISGSTNVYNYLKNTLGFAAA